MLKELTKHDWLKMLSLSEQEVPHTLILRGTRNLTEKFENHKKYFTDVREVIFPNGVFENIFIGNLNGHLVAFATVYGAPMASEVVHLFGVLGTTMVIHTGCCGGLDASLRTGDIFMATEAYIGEGASQHYQSDRKLVRASVQDTFGFDNIKTGRIYTTSALLAESREDIEAWAKLGCLTVDMETSAVFTTAGYFNMDCTSILFVFDNPSNEDHLFVENGDKTQQYTNGQNRILKITWHIADMHNKKLSKQTF